MHVSSSWVVSLYIDHACVLQLGGIGFVHYNMPLLQQIEAVQRVKQQPAGFEANPVILSPSQDLKQIQEIQAWTFVPVSPLLLSMDNDEAYWYSHAWST